jgi:hypothetical protein
VIFSKNSDEEGINFAYISSFLIVVGVLSFCILCLTLFFLASNSKSSFLTPGNYLLPVDDKNQPIKDDGEEYKHRHRDLEGY